MTNPLLNTGQLPAFSKITPGVIQPAIERIIDDNRREVVRLLENEEVSWDTLVKPLSLLEDRLSKA